MVSGKVFKVFNKKGISLIEVLMGMVIFLFVMLGFTGLTVNVMQSTDTTKKMIVANNLVIDKVEEILSTSYSNVTAEARQAVTNYPEYEREVIVETKSADAQGPARKEVTVNVYWKEGKDPISSVIHVTE